MTCMEQTPSVEKLNSMGWGYLPALDMTIYNEKGRWYYNDPNLGRTNVAEAFLDNGVIINGKIKHGFI
ncbi:MAG: hypothetical protein KAS04_06500 [Candidatus Aenigmarchaeota archaeon]|nr:hypothetical protein [Candidatus Aenigmarchaeota archaeon]